MGDWLGGAAALFGSISADAARRRAANRVKELQEKGLGYITPIADEGTSLFNAFEPQYRKETADYAQELLHGDPYGSAEDQYALDQAQGDINSLYSGAERDQEAAGEGRGVGPSVAALESGRLGELASSRRQIAMNRIRQRRLNREQGIGLMGGLADRGAGYMGTGFNAYNQAAGVAGGQAAQDVNLANMDLETLRGLAGTLSYNKRNQIPVESGWPGGTVSMQMPSDPGQAAGWAENFGGY